MLRLLGIFGAVAALAACSGQQNSGNVADKGNAQSVVGPSSSAVDATGSFAISGKPSDLYSAVVYMAGPGAGVVEQVLTSSALPNGASQQAILKSLDGSTFVELTKWTSVATRSAYKARYVAKASAYWRRDFAPVDQISKPQAAMNMTGSSNVQWSEFLLRDPSKQQELYEQASGMARNMVEAGPAELQTLTAMKSNNGSSIAILALWSNREGFGIFEKDATFGDDPYWAPVADNAHWMMRPILLR
jgi:hypothetical protein